MADPEVRLHITSDADTSGFDKQIAAAEKLKEQAQTTSDTPFAGDNPMAMPRSMIDGEQIKAEAKVSQDAIKDVGTAITDTKNKSDDWLKDFQANLDLAKVRANKLKEGLEEIKDQKAIEGQTSAAGSLGGGLIGAAGAVMAIRQALVIVGKPLKDMDELLESMGDKLPQSMRESAVDVKAASDIVNGMLHPIAAIQDRISGGAMKAVNEMNKSIQAAEVWKQKLEDLKESERQRERQWKSSVVQDQLHRELALIQQETVALNGLIEIQKAREAARDKITGADQTAAGKEDSSVSGQNAKANELQNAYDAAVKAQQSYVAAATSERSAGNYDLAAQIDKQAEAAGVAADAAKIAIEQNAEIQKAEFAAIVATTRDEQNAAIAAEAEQLLNSIPDSQPLSNAAAAAAADARSLIANGVKSYSEIQRLMGDMLTLQNNFSSDVTPLMQRFLTISQNNQDRIRWLEGQVSVLTQQMGSRPAGTR
jgi:hypothetical protein